MSELENIRNNALYDENDSRSFSRYKTDMYIRHYV